MAIAWVGDWGSGQFNNNTGGTLTGRTSTAGNFVAITATTNDPAGSTITHSQAGTVNISRPSAWEANAGDSIGTRHIENIVGGASHTITITTSASKFSTLNATEYSGIATSGSLDQTNVGTGTSTTLLSAATPTTTVADELLIGNGTINTGTNSAWTAGASYTIRGSETAGSSGSVSFLEDRIVAATGAYTAGASWSGASSNWICTVCTFKAPTAAATAEASFPFAPDRFDDVLPGEIRPFEVQDPDFNLFWFDAGGTPAAVVDTNQPWAQTVSGLLIPPPAPSSTVALGLHPSLVENLPVPDFNLAYNIPQPPPAALIIPGWNPSAIETVPVPILIRALALSQPPPFAAVYRGLDPSSIETVPVSILVSVDNILTPPLPAQVFVALTPGIAPVTSFFVPVITAPGLPQPVQPAAVYRGLDPSSVETVPVPHLISAASLAQLLQPAQVFVALQAGTPPATSFYVPLITGANIPQPLQAVRVALGLTPGTAPVTSFYVPLIQGQAPPQTPLQALVIRGLHDPLVETTPVVPFTYGRLAVAQPLQPVARLTALGPPYVAYAPTVYGTAIIIRLPDGRLYLGLTPGTPPPVGVAGPPITATWRLRHPTATWRLERTATWRLRRTGTEKSQSTGTWRKRDDTETWETQ